MDIQWTFTAKQVDLGRITLIRIRIEELLLMEIEVEKGKCEYLVVIHVFISWWWALQWLHCFLLIGVRNISFGVILFDNGSICLPKLRYMKYFWLDRTYHFPRHIIFFAMMSGHSSSPHFFVGFYYHNIVTYYIPSNSLLLSTKQLERHVACPLLKTVSQYKCN